MLIVYAIGSVIVLIDIVFKLRLFPVKFKFRFFFFPWICLRSVVELCTQIIIIFRSIFLSTSLATIFYCFEENYSARGWNISRDKHRKCSTAVLHGIQLYLVYVHFDDRHICQTNDWNGIERKKKLMFTAFVRQKMTLFHTDFVL